MGIPGNLKTTISTTTSPPRLYPLLLIRKKHPVPICSCTTFRFTLPQNSSKIKLAPKIYLVCRCCCRCYRKQIKFVDVVKSRLDRSTAETERANTEAHKIAFLHASLPVHELPEVQALSTNFYASYLSPVFLSKLFIRKRKLRLWPLKD